MLPEPPTTPASPRSFVRFSQKSTPSNLSSPLIGSKRSFASSITPKSTLVDTDEDDGFDADEMMLLIHKTRVDGCPEALAVQRLLASLTAKQSPKQSAIDAALLFLSEVPLSSVTEAQLAFVYFDGVPILLDLIPSLSLRSCSAACFILASAARHPVIQTTVNSENGVVVIANRLVEVMESQDPDCDSKLSLMVSLIDCLAMFCTNIAGNRKSLRHSISTNQSVLDLLCRIFVISANIIIDGHKPRDRSKIKKKINQNDWLISSLNFDRALQLSSSCCSLFRVAFKNNLIRNSIFQSDILKIFVQLLKSVISSSAPNINENFKSFEKLLIPLVSSLSFLVRDICFNLVDKQHYYFIQSEVIEAQNNDVLTSDFFAFLTCLLSSTWSSLELRLTVCSVLRYLIAFPHLNILLKNLPRIGEISDSKDSLQHLAALLSQNSGSNFSIFDLENVTACVALACISSENTKSLIDAKIIPVLAGLLNSDRLPAQIASSIALSMIARSKAHGPTAIKSSSIISSLIKSLLSTNSDLLIATTATLAALGQDKDCFKIITENDGLRLLWSLFKSENLKVKSNATAALIPLLSPSNAELVGRTFIGGLELLLNLLTQDYLPLLTFACSVVTRIAHCEANLNVVTEDGIVPLLSRIVGLTSTITTISDPSTQSIIFDESAPDNFSCPLSPNVFPPPIEGGLFRSVSDAVCAICNAASNRVRFSQFSIGSNFVVLLDDSRSSVQKAATFAVTQLAKCEVNSRDLLTCGAVPKLVNLLGSDDEEVQDSAAEAVGYVRRHFLQSNY
ncbi:hypothetical protein RCL1_006467 [Eukaryota sp. TZLM3-RCL]